MARLWAGLAMAGLVAMMQPARAQLVQNGNFTASTLPTSSEIGINGGQVTGWSGNGGYNFWFMSGTADTTGANQGSGYTPNCYYNTGCGSNLYLWGPGNGVNNGMPATDPAGGDFVALDGDYNTQPLTQTINGLTKGTVYALSFYYAFSQQAGYTGTTIQNLSASLGSSAAQSVGAYTLPSQGFSGWKYQTFYFEATSSSELLSFLASGNVQLPPFALLGDVTMIATPEPATWGMLAVGLLGVVGLARARRAQRAA